MSEFHVRVVKLDKIERHSNADSLSIADVEGYPVIFNHIQNNYRSGDLVVYIPIDSIVPDVEQWAFLEGHRRIKAKKLRGVFSMGMLAPLPNPSWKVGQNVQKEMGIVKWEPDGHHSTEVVLDEATIVWNKKPLWKKLLTARFYRRAWWKFLKRFEEGEINCSEFTNYTDIEGLRKYSRVLIPGEEVILTEKTHGQSGRFGRMGKKFYVGSHYYFKGRPKWAHDKINNWWQIAIAYNLENILPEGYGFYGEVYGTVQKGFSYDAPGKLAVRFFDIKNLRTGHYLDYDDFIAMCSDLNLPVMPVLYRGPWKEELREMAEGKSTFGPHIREGFVVRPVKERHEPSIGRCILKLVGQQYMLSKDS